MRKLTDRQTTLIAFLIGAVVAVCVYTPGYVLGTSYWWSYPPRDFNSHLIGYRMYMLDAWRFPLFFTATMDEPRGLNLLYMDALPIVALPAKVIAPIVPSFLKTVVWNPFGWWPVVSYGLQAVFGSRLMRELGATSVVARLAGAVFAIATPVFVFRFLHTALASHFLLLWAIVLYLTTVRGATWRRAALGWSIHFAVVALIHPYIFAMCAGIFAAALGTWALAKRFRDAALVGGIPVVVVLVISAVGGFFGKEVAKGGLWGYGYKTTDLFSFVTPQWATLFPFTNHPLRMDMVKTEAAEGYAYLGMGGIVLFVLMFVLEPKTIGRAIKNHKLLFVACMLMAWFAVSHRVSFAGKVLFEMPLPGFMDWPARQFRSCGRFIWPAVYCSSFYLLALAFRRFERHRFFYVPLFIVGIQFVDILAAYVYVNGYTGWGQPRYLRWDVVRPVVHAHRGVTFGPAVDCIDWTQPMIFLKHMEIEFLASEKGIGISNMKGSRPLIDCARDNSHRALDEVKPNQLYLIFPPDVPPSESAHYELGGAPCTKHQNMIACSSRFKETTPPEFTPFKADIDYELDSIIKLGDASEPDKRFLGVGWSWPEGTHRWATGDASIIYLRLSERIPEGTRLHVRGGGAISPRRPRVVAEVRINQRSIGEMPLESEPRDYDLPLPRDLDATTFEIQIRPSDFRSAKELGESEDERQLGMAVLELSLRRPAQGAGGDPGTIR